MIPLKAFRSFENVPLHWKASAEGDRKPFQAKDQLSPTISGVIISWRSANQKNHSDLTRKGHFNTMAIGDPTGRLSRTSVKFSRLAQSVPGFVALGPDVEPPQSMRRAAPFHGVEPLAASRRSLAIDPSELVGP